MSFFAALCAIPGSVRKSPGVYPAYGDRGGVVRNCSHFSAKFDDT